MYYRLRTRKVTSARVGFGVNISRVWTECHPPERRRPLRRVLYTLSVGDLESDDNTSRESSSESENDMSTDNAPGALDTSLSYPLSVERIGGQAVERAYLRCCPCEGCWTACCHLLQVW